MKNMQDLTKLMNTKNQSCENEYKALVHSYVEIIHADPEGLDDVLFLLSRWEHRCRKFILSDIEKELKLDGSTSQQVISTLEERLYLI